VRSPTYPVCWTNPIHSTFKTKNIMQRSIEEIASELIQLPKRERLEIARFLLFLDNRSFDSSDVSSDWEQEITDRVRAVEDGTAIGIDYEKAKKQIESRFT